MHTTSPWPTASSMSRRIGTVPRSSETLRAAMTGSAAGPAGLIGGGRIRWWCSCPDIYENQWKISLSTSIVDFSISFLRMISTHHDTCAAVTFGWVWPRASFRVISAGNFVYLAI